MRYVFAFDKIRLLGFTHYTTRMLRNSAMPGSLTPRHKGTLIYLSKLSRYKLLNAFERLVLPTA